MADRLMRLSDSDLVRAHRAGDARAFETLADRHLGVIYLIGFSVLRDREAAEDLVQEVMLRALLGLDRLERTSLFSAWLTQIARNLAIDWLRRGQRHSRLVPLVPLDEAALEVPDFDSKGAREAMSEKEDRVAVREALRRLPPEQREVALLHVVEGLGQREIARRMGLSQATVSRQLNRALLGMRDSLEALRRAAPSLRLSPEVRTQTLALVGAAMLLSPAAKASLVASAGLTAGSGAAAAAGGLGALSTLKVALATGGHIMAIGKGIPVTLGVAALITGGAYHLSQADGPTTGGAPAQLAVLEEHSTTEMSEITVTPPPPPAVTPPTPPVIAEAQAEEHPEEVAQLEAEIQAQIEERVQPFIEEITEEVMAEIMPMVAQIEDAANRNDVIEVIRLAMSLQSRADEIEARAEARAAEFEAEMEAWAENLEGEMGFSTGQWSEMFSESMETAFAEEFEADMEQWAEEFEASMEAWAENLEAQFD